MKKRMIQSNGTCYAQFIILKVVTITRNKVVSRCPSVGNQTSQLAILVENNTVGTRGATIVDLARAQNRELVPVAGNGEVKALVVVVLVGVVVGCLARLVEAVAGVLGSGDLAVAVVV